MAVNISKWVAAEIHKTELELLRAEDELANAQLRVAALQQRAQRLKGKQQHLPVDTAADVSLLGRMRGMLP